MSDLERARAALAEDPDEMDEHWLAGIIAAARREALEDAARICEQGYTTGSTASTLKAIAKAIRALKEKRDD